MPTFKYNARDREGKAVSGFVTAKNQADAVSDLRKRSLVVLDVKQSGTATKGKGGFLAGLSKARPSASKEQLVLFTRQLATMISAGVPLLESLESSRSRRTPPASGSCSIR